MEKLRRFLEMTNIGPKEKTKTDEFLVDYDPNKSKAELFSTIF